MTAVCGAYIAFYWADDPQVDSRSRVDALVAGGSMMAIPDVLTALVLSRVLRDRFGAPTGCWSPSRGRLRWS
ncbi:hypothetical protein ABZZ74_16990 [Streptomyces sp. NPDC006476]|uniref:hypothetical protein n=1 Tax=Streptomyces sp. NPDC006476 TaxID=3157175 RepID=UPI0033B58496